MTKPSPESDAWFCLRAQPKHEHIAAAHLKKMDGLDVFLPRVRFRRATRQGPAWVTEALFPGYLFARFAWELARRQVQAAPGVRGIVHFGPHVPVISDAIIEELRRTLGAAEFHTIPEDLTPGDTVVIAEGALRGLHAVVTRIMAGRERIAVLMELLGQQTTVELTPGSVVREGSQRAILFEDRDRDSS